MRPLIAAAAIPVVLVLPWRTLARTSAGRTLRRSPRTTPTVREARRTPRAAFARGGDELAGAHPVLKPCVWTADASHMGAIPPTPANPARG